MKWFKRGTAKPTQSVAESPSMHILPLNPHTNLPLGVCVRDTSSIALPAITTDGRLSLLPAGNEDDFRKFEKDVLVRVQKLPKECVAYMCVAVVIKDPDRINPYLVYEVRGFTAPIPELEHAYHLLANLRKTGDTYWTDVEKFLSSEPARSWINAIIEFAKQDMNWMQYVEQALARLKTE